VSSALSCHHTHPPSILLLVSPKADSDFFHPTEGRKLKQGTAGRVLQPTPKTAYRNDCRDECNRCGGGKI